MSARLPVILIFDVGKTNKKLLLFNERYQLVYEETIQLDEIKDEDGHPCEDLNKLSDWILKKANEVTNHIQFEVKAINFAAYGASLVFLDEKDNVVTPLYNYLKPFPEQLLNKFYSDYGGIPSFPLRTASPVLGNLNSGMQLYRFKYEKPQLFTHIRKALHLPQYLSFLFTRVYTTELTSIGCHTNMWDFEKGNYHDWIFKENLISLFPEIKQCDAITGNYKNIPVGIGIHDSSSALIPYLLTINEPFILLSTGTWNITLNPFNQSSLTENELNKDCLCYLSYEGKPVKASRLFAGNEHEKQVKRLATHFNKPIDHYTSLVFNTAFSGRLKSNRSNSNQDISCVFKERNLNDFDDYSAAYHQLIIDLVEEQIKSTSLVLSENVKKMFVDGGFAKNSIYMNLMAEAFPEIEVYAASIPHATALGAALLLHNIWNKKHIPDDIIKTDLYTPSPMT